MNLKERPLGRSFQMDILEYEKQQAVIKLLSKLSEAEDMIKTGEEWESLDELREPEVKIIRRQLSD